MNNLLALLAVLVLAAFVYFGTPLMVAVAIASEGYFWPVYLNCLAVWLMFCAIDYRFCNERGTS